MNTNTQSLVQKLWTYCNVLRDDGMSLQAALEQFKLIAGDLDVDVMEEV